MAELYSEPRHQLPGQGPSLSCAVSEGLRFILSPHSLLLCNTHPKGHSNPSSLTEFRSRLGRAQGRVSGSETGCKGARQPHSVEVVLTQARKPGLELCHLLAVWPLVTYNTSLTFRSKWDYSTYLIGLRWGVNRLLYRKPLEEYLVYQKHL